MELLSPAGSPEAVVAAVQNGADAVYLGYGDFNARRNAANFTEEELHTAVEYCHLRGTKVYLTLNTLLRDRELDGAARSARLADEIGVDAVLVQDLGVARMVKAVAPELALHASTQMNVHNLDGVKLCADLGMTRAVLSRELSWDQIEGLCARSPIEIEVFVHGALCMCYSGQCFMSSVIGGRSGNRGLCAQPCRLNYGWNGRADKPLLSLKDMSLAGHLRRLEDIGVACAKIEGRMKRPEYVAIVTGIYAAALRERREPTREELEALRLAFSRQGFTDGYFMDKTGREMFGVREENAVDPTPMFQKAKAEYRRGEHPKVEIYLEAQVSAGQPVTVTAFDQAGNTAAVTGEIPEAARNRAVMAEDVEKQLGKTGGTPYLAQVTARVEEGLSLPASKLNGLRRAVLEQLSALRVAPPAHTQYPWQAPERVKTPLAPPAFTLSLMKWVQLTPELLARAPARISLPLEEAFAHRDALETLCKTQTFAVELPRVLWDRESPQAERMLGALKDCGVTQALTSTWGGTALAKRLGFTLLGDYGLGVTNSETVRGLEAMGFASATVSFEQRTAQIRDLSRNIPLEMIVYGRLPAMIMENCIIQQRTGTCQRACEQDANQNLLTDRRGAQFPVVRAFGCRNEILNSKILFLADRQEDYAKLGMTYARLRFTTESPAQCVTVLDRYLNRNDWTPEDVTRGLYFREVE